MAPTAILAKQHYNLAKNIFRETNIKIKLLTGKTETKMRKKILDDLNQGKINLLIGTHALFQKIKFKNLGYIIIDEQHKFGVKQRMSLAEKGGLVMSLLMSATPIPRTMMLTIYGDMDVSRLTEKPKNRLPILTYSKPEKKKKNSRTNKIIKKLSQNNQVFWVCPLIKDSQILDYSSVNKRFEWLKKKFPYETGILHGELKKMKKI